MSFLAASTSSAGTTSDDQDYNISGPIPLSFGSNRIKIKYFEQPWNYTVNDEGKTRQDGYWYSLAGLIQHGPVSRCLGIWTAGSVDPVYGPFNLGTDYTYINHVWGDFNIKFRLYRGSVTQSVDPRLNGISGGTFKAAGGNFIMSAAPNVHPAYKNLSYIVFDTFKTSWQTGGGGNAGTNIPDIEVGTYSIPETIIIGNESEHYGVNPISALYEALHNVRYGLSITDSQYTALWQDGWSLPVTEWIAAAGRYSSQFGPTKYIHPIWTKRQKTQQVLTDMLEYFDGFFRRPGHQILIDWIKPSGTVDTTGLPMITQSDLTEVPTITNGKTDDVVSGVVIKYTDPVSFGSNESRVSNPFSEALVAEPEEKSIEREWIHDDWQAKELANRYVQLNTYPTLSGNIKVRASKARNTDGTPIIAGDIFVYTDAYSENRLCRCTQSVFSSGRARELEFREEFGTWLSAVVPDSDPILDPAENAPVAITNAKMWLPPAAICPDELRMYLVPLVEAPDYCNSAQVWINDKADFDGGEQQLTDLPVTAFASYGTLSGAISSDGTSMEFTFGNSDLTESFSTAQIADGYMLAIIGDEIIVLGALTGSTDTTRTFTIVRGVYGTTNVAHDSGDDVWIIQRSALSFYSHPYVATGSYAWLSFVSVGTWGESDVSEPFIATDLNYVTFEGKPVTYGSNLTTFGE